MMKRRYGVIFLAVLVALGFAVGGYLWMVKRYDYPLAAYDVAEVAARYRQAGLPWEAKDLAPEKPVSDAENAAPLIHKAMAMRTPPYDYKKMGLWSYAIQERQFGSVLKDLAKFDPVLKVAIQASKRPRLDFHWDLDMSYWMTFKEFAPVKTWVRYLTRRAEAKAGLGDVDGALDDLRAGWRLADLMGQEPLLFGLLFRIGCESIVMAGVENCAWLLKDRPEALRRLDDVLANRSPYEHARVVVADAYCALAGLRNTVNIEAIDFAHEDSENPTIPIMRTPLQRTGLPDGLKARAYAAQSMRMWIEAKLILDRYGKDPEELYPRLQALGDRYGKKEQPSFALNQNELATDFSDSFLRADAQRNTKRALLAALLVRARTGRMPTRIAEIPGKWIDPYTKQPLRIATADGGWRIYSVGRNRKDDGGLALGADDIPAYFPPRHLWLRPDGIVTVYKPEGK